MSSNILLNSLFLQAARNEALSISTDLVEKIGLTNSNDLKQYTIGMLNQLLSKSLSPFGVEMMGNVFGVQSSSVTLEAAMCVGKGFNVLNDALKPSAIFETINKAAVSQYGITIPPGVTMKKVQESEIYMENYEDEQSYVKSRLVQLNINADVDYKLFSMKTRGGFTRKRSGQGTMNVSEWSFLMERRLFQLEMPDHQHCDMKLTETFKNAVKNRLPSAYAIDSKEVRSDYENFFETWGHFIVTSAYGGGCVEAKVNIMTTSSSAEAALQIRADLEASFRGLSGGLAFDMEMEAESSGQTSSRSSLATSSLKWVGGDSKYHAMNLKDTTPEQWKLWQASLASNPAVLSTDMSLLPIHNVVELVDPNKVRGCKQALEDFLGGEFAAIKKRENEMKEKERKIKEEAEEARRKKEAESTPDPQPGPSCYASSSKVYLHGMSIKTVADVNIGDSLLVSAEGGTLKFSKVVIINHRSPDAIQEFCQIFYDQEREPLKITSKHIVMVNGIAQYAGEVKVGDTLLVLDKTRICLEERLVQKVEKISLRGFHAPITMDGKLVVDEVLTSCYAHVPDKVVLGRKVSGHQLAHIGMVPFRIMRKMNVATKMLEIKEGEDMPQAIQWAVRRVLPHIFN